LKASITGGATYSDCGEADADDEVAGPVEEASDHEGRGPGSLTEELGSDQPRDGSCQECIMTG